MKRYLFSFAVTAMTFALAAPAVAAPPDQNVEFVIDDSGTVLCDGVTLDRESKGWVLFAKELGGNRNERGRNFHITTTYTNPQTLDTWAIQGTGHIQFFFVDGEFHVSVSGHSDTAPPDDSLNYGRWVINLDTGEFSVVGSNRGIEDDAACEALVG